MCRKGWSIHNVSLYFLIKRPKKRTKKKDAILDLIENLPERYKKTALRKIDEGEKLTFDKEKGIVNEKGEIVVEYSVCKDRIVVESINDEGDNKEEGKGEEVKNGEKKNSTQNDKEMEEDEDDDESYDEEEEEDEEGEIEEVIDTHIEKNKIKK